MIKRIVLVLSMLVLVFSVTGATNPAKAITKWDLIIINETLKSVKFNLENEDPDEPSYNFSAVGYDTTTKVIKHGEYLFTYQSCNPSVDYKGKTINFVDADLIDDLDAGPDYYPWEGIDFYEDMTIGSLTNDKTGDDNDITITLHACQGQPEKTKMVFYSHLDGELTIELSSLNEQSRAKNDYSLKVSTGTNRFTKIWSGPYLYTYDACDQTFSGELYIEKSGDSQFVIRSCEYLTLEGYGQLIPQNSDDVDVDRQTPSNFTIFNRSDQTFNITLVGPVTYLKNLSIGANKYEIVPGTYQYICAVHDYTYRGTVKVTATGASSLTVPPAVQEKKQLENVTF
jgi:hypothetical protein